MRPLHFLKNAKMWKGLLCLALAMGTAGLFCACSGKKENTDLGNYEKYLGDYDYDYSISAMVFETPEGEETPGVMYRQVKDLDALVKNCPIPICFLFYSSMHADVYGVFACLEEMTELHHDQVLVVTIDAMSEKNLSSAYNIESLPEGIVIRDGKQTARFNGKEREEWTARQLADWILEEATK